MASQLSPALPILPSPAQPCPSLPIPAYPCQQAPATFDLHTEAEELEDPPHGGLDVGRVVLQAQDEELLSVEDGEPVQEVHSVQPHLQAHLGGRKAWSTAAPGRHPVEGATSGAKPQEGLARKRPRTLGLNAVRSFSRCI